MMLLVGSLLLGIIGGTLCFIWEHQLCKEFDEIEVEKKWPIGILPAVSGILCMLSARNAMPYIAAFINILLISLFVLLTCFDVKYMILPTKVIVIGIIFELIWQIVYCLMTKDIGQLVDSFLGGIIGFGLFGLIFYGSRGLLKRDGLGFGDVRLMALIGMVVGLSQIFIVIIIASVLAVIVGGMLFMVKKQSEAFPFGPFLCFGTIVMMLFGNDILSFYFQCLT